MQIDLDYPLKLLLNSLIYRTRNTRSISIENLKLPKHLNGCGGNLHDGFF